MTSEEAKKLNPGDLCLVYARIRGIIPPYHSGDKLHIELYRINEENIIKIVPEPRMRFKKGDLVLWGDYILTVDKEADFYEKRLRLLSKSEQVFFAGADEVRLVCRAEDRKDLNKE